MTDQPEAGPLERGADYWDLHDAAPKKDGFAKSDNIIRIVQTSGAMFYQMDGVSASNLLEAAKAEEPADVSYGN
jgi:hypothetical protein